MNFRIRRLTPDDQSACVDLAVARGWAPDHHRWTHFLTHSHTYGAHLVDGTLISTIVATRLTCREPGRDVVAIGMMVVDSQHERQGLGTAMMRHVMEVESNAGYCLQATRFGLPVYSRLGFTDQGTTTVLTAPLLALLSHPMPVSALQPTSEPICADAKLGPCVPDRWSHLHGTLYVHDAPLVNRDHTTAVAVWRNGETLHIGPITAPTSDDAVKAVLAALHHHGPHASIERVRIEVPPGQDDFLERLRHLGFKDLFTVVEMTLGDVGPRNPRQRALMSVATA